jgi:hypothetical protein
MSGTMFLRTLIVTFLNFADRDDIVRYERAKPEKPNYPKRGGAAAPSDLPNLRVTRRDFDRQAESDPFARHAGC